MAKKSENQNLPPPFRYRRVTTIMIHKFIYLAKLEEYIQLPQNNRSTRITNNHTCTMKKKNIIVAPGKPQQVTLLGDPELENNKIQSICNSIK